MKVTFPSIIMFWIAFAVVMTGVMTLVHPMTNRPESLWGEFVWELGFALAWIAGTPAALYAARRFNVVSHHGWKNGSVLFAVGILLSTVQCLLHGLVIGLLHPDSSGIETNVFLTSLFYNIDKMLIVFTALVIMQHAMEYYLKYQEKELAASKLETQLSQAQMKALKMQLQPHFLFNTLNAIVTLVRKDPDLAEEMIVRLSDFLRLTLDASGKQLIPLKEEMDFIRSYLAIEEIRFNGRLKFQDSIPAELFDAPVPMLILQPLVENSIKHGIAQHEDSGLLEISARRQEGNLSLTVCDDAAPSEDVSRFSEGIGLTNTRNRLQALYGDAAAVSVTPAGAKGLCVSISFPMRGSRV